MKIYRDVLSAAWEHTIQRPGLWIFGFFATLVFGVSGEFDRYLRYMNALVTDGHGLNIKSWLDGVWIEIAISVYQQLVAGNVGMWCLLGITVLSVMIVLWLMGVSVGALVHSARHKTESFNEAFMAGLKHWEQLLALFISTYLVVGIGSLSVVVLILNLMAEASYEQVELVIVLVAGLVFVPLVIVVSLLVRLTSMSVVLDNAHIGAAVHKAWKLFREQWLVIVEMAIISFVVTTAASFVLLLCLIMIFLPYIISLSVSNAVVNFLLLQNAVVYGQWIFLALSLFTAAILSTWQWSAWTLLFDALRTNKLESTLVKWIRGVK